MTAILKFKPAAKPFPGNMNLYQQYIAKSRYSRYLPQHKRREHWNETCTRVIKFFSEQPQLAAFTDWQFLYDSMYNLQALPSMRVVMTAGEALDRNHIAAYNCAYAPIESLFFFHEAMLILLHGTGVGFSVEEHYVEQLPVMPASLEWSTKAPWVIEDTKEGWVNAYQALWKGLVESAEILSFDFSKIRAKGTPLKTFGGRASGPKPLAQLFHYTVDKVRGAVGRKLTTAECHDLACMVGQVVVVGGVRRSALISLGGLHDENHRGLKSGNEWRKKNPERELSNNSAVFERKPDSITFINEFSALAASGSGERGIFNREASRVQAARWGRRDYNRDYGTNPCSEIILRPHQFCNLSTSAVRAGDRLTDLLVKNTAAALFGTMQATLTKFHGLRDIWRQNTEEERLLGVSMTGVCSNELTNGSLGHDRLAYTLQELRENARIVNETWAPLFGIQDSAAITCIKPEGTASLLLNTEGAGLHPEHDKFFVRRIRQNDTDPIIDFLFKNAIPMEPNQRDPAQSIITLPFKAEGMVKDSMTAIEHLELWLSYQRSYCEHKPSVTVSIKPDEWAKVGGWVYENFDEVTGVAFLPDFGDHGYVQPPLSSCSEEEYKELLSRTPKAVDWDSFVEDRDNVEGVQTLACTANGCAIL
jgi:ribonucleoside-triphosphate reductase